MSESFQIARMGLGHFFFFLFLKQVPICKCVTQELHLSASVIKGMGVTLCFLLSKSD